MPVILIRNKQLKKLQEGFPDSLPTEASILVVPTKRRIRYLTRDILSRRQSAVADLSLYTLESLARKIFGVAFDLRLVEDPIKTLLFGQALDTSRKMLKYFYVRERGNSLPRGTLDKVIQVISHLKEFGIYPEQLAEELTSEEDEDKPKLSDIVTLYSAYEKGLAELRGVDDAGVFKILSSDCTQPKFEDAFRKAFPQAQMVSIVGFDEFTEPELGVIRKISLLDTNMSVAFDYQPGNDALFGHLTENYKRFLEIGFAAPSASPSDAALHLRQQQEKDVREMIQHVAQHLFQREAAVEKRRCTERITLAKAKDRLGEVELICKLIKQLKADHPSMDLSRVCVAMYRPQVYTHLMREQFKKYGIRANITDRFELSQSPVVVAIIGLLEVAVHGFRREDVFRCSGAAYFEFNNNGTPLDGANLMEAARELRIVAGVQRWVKAIEQSVQKHRHDVLMSMDDEENARRERHIDALLKAKSDILWFEAALSAISLDQTAMQFLQRLQQLLESLRLPQRILSIGVSRHPEIIEQDARAYAKLLEVAEQTVRLMEYQDGKNRRHALQFFVEQLKIAISQERYNVREQFGHGVLVTSIDETRGLPVDVMIVAGLVDGEFPSVYQSELFFGGKRLKEREQRHSWENRYLFYQAITNWSDHLYLTYPEQEAELDLVRSSFVDALLKIVDVEQWTYPGTSPLENTIYSEQDFLRYQGEKFLAASPEKADRVPDSLHEQVKHISQALAVESSRIELHNLPQYEGLLSGAISGEASEQLEQLRHRVYSVSQLETYGKCPYQYFAQRLLRLNVMEDVEEEFSALDKGSILHDILFEFYTARRENNLPPLIGCADHEFDEALQQLLGIAGRKLSELDIPDPFWELEKELILGDKKEGQGILKEFLAFERSRSSSLQPKYFEVGFGSQLGSQTRIDRSFSSEDPILAGKIHLRGKVDRVETNDSIFSIVDYKTGKELPRLDDIRSGISLQLPIYLYTIEQLLQKKQGQKLVPAAGVYYQVRSPVALKVGVGSENYKHEFGIQRSKVNLLPSDDELRDLIADSIARVNTYVDDMAAGRFPLTSHDKIDKVCTYCDYKTICRIQTVRRVEKPKPEAT